MYPILFKIPGLGFPITTFGLMVVLGFLAGSYLFTRVGMRYERDPQAARGKLDSVPVWGLIGVIVGARLMYVAVEIARGSVAGRGFIEAPETVLFVFRGGLVMYGGAFGGFAGGWWATHKHGLNYRHLVDIGTIAAFLGLTIGRIGCLLVGDDHGTVVPDRWSWLPFPITVKVPDVLADGSLFGEENAGQILWATQIWMSLNALVLCLVGYWLLGRRRFQGQVTLQILVLYSFARFAIEFFRGDEVRGIWFGGALSTSQLISIAVAIVCGTWLFLWRGRRDSDAGVAPRG